MTGITEAFKADGFKEKINLGVGAYREHFERLVVHPAMLKMHPRRRQWQTICSTYGTTSRQEDHRGKPGQGVCRHHRCSQVHTGGGTPCVRPTFARHRSRSCFHHSINLGDRCSSDWRGILVSLLPIREEYLYPYPELGQPQCRFQRFGPRSAQVPLLRQEHDRARL